MGKVAAMVEAVRPLMVRLERDEPSHDDTTRPDSFSVMTNLGELRAIRQALSNLPARAAAIEKVVEAATAFKTLAEHQYFQAEKIGDARQKLFDAITEYDALLLPLGRRVE
jgi:hypothetical protein